MKVLLAFLLISTASALQASDTAKEARWAKQVVDFLLDGEVEYLKVDGHEFLSIYTEADDESNKAIIVVHGAGVHPDWAQVVKPVRVDMVTMGWNTLSIQMPILHNEAEYEEYVPLYPQVPARFQAAETFLKDLGMEHIVIVAHSQGATMSTYYLSRNASDVKALVAVGMQATQKDVHINSGKSLESIAIPVLDLYGSKDLEGVLETVDSRKQAAANNPKYQQMVTEGAEHFYDGYETELVESISGWLESLSLSVR